MCVVYVERAVCRDELDQAWGAVAIAHLEGEGKALTTGAAAPDGKPQHSHYIPKPSGFILSSDAQRHGNVAEAVRDLFENPGVVCDDPGAMRDALRRFKEKSADFPHALLAALAAERGVPVASFDRDFDRFKDVKRFEPKE